MKFKDKDSGNLHQYMKTRNVRKTGSNTGNSEENKFQFKEPRSQNENEPQNCRSSLLRTVRN
jgi:hypothetical protein